MIINCRAICLLPILPILEVCSAEISVCDVQEMLKNFVSNSYYSCSVVILSPGSMTPRQTKKMMQNKSTQIMLTERAISVDPKSSCVHLIWLEGWDGSVKAVLKEVTQTQGPHNGWVTLGGRI